MPFFKFFGYIIILVFIDLLTKYLFFDMGLAQNIFYSTLNHGISFGIDIGQTIIQTVTILFLLVILFFWSKKKIQPWVAILILAGGLGNLFDRIFLGGVRDFIRLGIGPVFNIADIYINLAVVFIIIFERHNNS